MPTEQQTETRREKAEEIAQGFRKQLGFRLNDIIDLADAIEAALKDRDERAARIADERAAFNRRLAGTYNIGDPMADLKFTRADEAEIIASEIRGADA